MRQTKIICNSLIIFLGLSLYTIPVFAAKKENTESIGESVGDIIDSLFGEEKSNDQVEGVREYIEQMSPNERLDFNKKLHDMSPAERKQFRKRLHDMGKDEEKEYFSDQRKQFREKRVNECERRKQMKKQKNKSQETVDQTIESLTDITIDDIAKYLFDNQDETLKDQRENIQEDVANMSPSERKSFYQDLRDMNTGERKRFRKKLHKLSPEEKRKYFRERSNRGCKQKIGKVRIKTDVKQLPGGVTVP